MHCGELNMKGSGYRTIDNPFAQYLILLRGDVRAGLTSVQLTADHQTVDSNRSPRPLLSRICLRPLAVSLSEHLNR